MLYNEKKVKEIARSLLPSKGRKAARKEKKAAKQAHRRSIHQLVSDIGECEECFEASPELFDDSDVREVVGKRRTGDKVAPLLRWAAARTKNLPQQDRLAHIKSILPRASGVVGQHAVQHVSYMEEMHDPSDLTYSCDYSAWEIERAAKRKEERRVCLRVAQEIARRPWLEASANWVLREATVWRQENVPGVRWVGEVPYFRTAMDAVEWRERLLARTDPYPGSSIRPHHYWKTAILWMWEQLTDSELNAFPRRRFQQL